MSNKSDSQLLPYNCYVPVKGEIILKSKQNMNIYEQLQQAQILLSILQSVINAFLLFYLRILTIILFLIFISFQ